MLTQKERAAEERTRETLLDNGWTLRPAHGSEAVTVAEKAHRVLYGTRLVEIVQTANERRAVPRNTREGRAQRVAA
jgi:hypothetical protein